MLIDERWMLFAPRRNAPKHGMSQRGIHGIEIGEASKVHWNDCETT